MQIKKCPDGHYTLKDICHCGKKAHSAHPAKFSEKLSRYRRMARKEL